MKVIDYLIKVILIFLLIFTPIAFGSVELWAFSLMELGILLIMILGAILRISHPISNPGGLVGAAPIPPFRISFVLCSLFLILILFQMIPIPPEIMKIISPKTYELRHTLAVTTPHSAFRIPHSTVSFVPFITKIEFFKWLTLSGLFLFLLFWRFSGDGFRILNHLIIVIFLTGAFESLYGMFEFFSGHHQILHFKGISSVTGTFINQNYFAGYLLMVIPLSMGFLFSRESIHRDRFMGWRQRLSAFDGKTALIAFGVMVMILGLLFSASRIGILSLILSFSLISLLFKDSRKGKRFSKTSVLILGLALLWAVWIGVDAVIGRFFNVSGDFESRWMIWANAFEILKDFPILGSGLGTFGMIFPMYQSFHIRKFVTHTENDFLQLASEVGLVGFGLLVILFIFLFVNAVSRIRSLSDLDPQRHIGIGGLVGILALMFYSLVERNLQVPANAFLFTFILALALQPSKKSIGTSESLDRYKRKMI